MRSNLKGSRVQAGGGGSDPALPIAPSLSQGPRPSGNAGKAPALSKKPTPASREAASLEKQRQKIKLPICARALDPIKSALGGGRGGSLNPHKVLSS